MGDEMVSKWNGVQHFSQLLQHYILFKKDVGENNLNFVASRLISASLMATEQDSSHLGTQFLYKWPPVTHNHSLRLYFTYLVHNSLLVVETIEGSLC